MSKRSNPRAEQLRTALAQEAARIMSEQGIDDYGLAKRKAAERFGASDIAVLPKNTEIEAALAACRGRVAGSAGAAAKLGVPASTLDHRIKALGISKTQFKFR